MTKIIPEEKARQGRSGKRVLYVLLAALALVVIVWGGVEYYGEFIENSPPAAGSTANPG